MIVMKFGGTSVANAEAVSRTISIVRGKLSERPVVVVSALSKVTDLLYGIAECAAAGDRAGAEERLSLLRCRHDELAEKLLAGNPELMEKALSDVDGICGELSSFVLAVCSLGELSDRSKARIISNGEWLSSTIICHAMNASGIRTAFADARRMIITSREYMKGEPLTDEIAKRVPEVLEKAWKGSDAVITQGFIASTISGEPSVLGRGGSDYSASLIGMAADASRIEIWTDVDGVRTADPRVVVNTRSIDCISFGEAAEMAHSGAKVLHPMTIEPAVVKNIPVHVLNSMNPGGQGTAILGGSQSTDGVKSVAFRENITLISISSPGMLDVSGLLRRVFGVLSEYRLPVEFVSTSETGISIAVDGSLDTAEAAARMSEFASVAVCGDKSLISVIGKNIAGLHGLLRGTMSSLRDCKVYMISQGESFVNISFVVDRESLGDAVREVHKYLFETKENESGN